MADYMILKALAESGLLEIQTPSVIATNLDFSKQHVHRRLSNLVERGLVEKVDRGKYRITDRGRAFIAGDLDADDLEE